MFVSTKLELLFISIILLSAFSYFLFGEFIPISTVVVSAQNQADQQEVENKGISNNKDYTAVVAAIIAACASVIGVVFTNYFGKRSQKELAALQERSDITKMIEKARIEYEYEARKRLYNEVEPILFQLFDLSASAYSRILSLTRASRNGNLEPDNGWLTGIGYFTLSTIYRLMAPMSACKLLQRGVTRVDLAVDPSFGVLHHLAKGLYPSFSRDFEAASQQPAIEYNPDSETISKEEKNNNPAKYRRQGVFMGTLDILADALIIFDEGNKTPRIISYGEFSNRYFRPVSDGTKGPFGAAVHIFLNFHPRTSPVLWRVLLLQAHVYKAIMNTYENKSSELPNTFKPLKIAALQGQRKEFDWRQPRESNEITDAEVLEYPFKAVENLVLTDFDLEKMIETADSKD